ncbi:MAG: cysteine peptidase family C39 domain-containing protein [Gemmataceae bacterium]
MIPTLAVWSFLALGEATLADKEIVNPDDFDPCGLTSFFLSCRLMGIPLEWERAKELIGPTAEDGTHSFEDIARAARDVGLHPVGLHARLEALSDLPMPAIVHVRDPRRPGHPPHLLVFLRRSAEGVILLDPPMPAYILPEADFANVWSGNVLVFARDAEEAEALLWPGRVHLAKQITAAVALLLGLLTALTLLPRWIRTRRLARGTTPVGVGASHQWSRFLIGAAAATLLAAVSVAAFWFWPRSPAGPRLVVDNVEIPLGELAPGEAKAEVVLRNVGDAPLTISAVRSTCTCASAAPPGVINPASSAAIAVTLNVNPGPQHARLVIESEDPGGPQTVFLSWHGKSRPTLDPVYIGAERVPADRPFERTVKLIYPAGPGALAPRLEKVECDSPFVELHAGRLDPASLQRGVISPGRRQLGELELLLHVKAPSASSRVESMCRLTVAVGSQRHQMRLPVSITFLGGEVMPELGGLVFSAPSASKLVGLERTLKVSSRSGRGDVEVTNLPPWLTCGERKGGEPLLFRVTKPPSGASGEHTVFLRLKGEPATSVPVKVHWVSPG